MEMAKFSTQEHFVIEAPISCEKATLMKVGKGT